MKKLTILLTVALISTAAFAQGSIDNEVYFRFGYSLPTWKQFGGTKSDWSDLGFQKRGGFMGEVGTIFMLKSIPLPDGMAIGIDADYISFYFQRFNVENEFGTIDLATLRVDSKVGPSFTYSPVKNVAFDVYAKVDVSWVTATAIIYDENADDAEGYGKIAAVGLSTGFNVRLSVVMLGFEFNTLSPKLENVDSDGDYLGQINNDDNTDKTPLPSMNFTLGFSF